MLTRKQEGEASASKWIIDDFRVNSIYSIMTPIWKEWVANQGRTKEMDAKNLTMNYSEEHIYDSFVDKFLSISSEWIFH